MPPLGSTGPRPARRDRLIAGTALVVPLLLAAAAMGYALWRAGFTFDATRHAERVMRLRSAQAAGDLDAEAAANAELGREGFRTARACVRTWRALQDPETDLFPRGGDEDDERMLWNGGDTAADLFPHLLYAAIRVAPEEEPAWRAAFATERRLAGGLLPRTIRLQPATVIEEPEPDLLASGAEYAADGLVPLVERLGEGPWLDRLREILDQVIARAAVTTSRGPIPSGRAEVNGNLLQVLARLYPLTRDERHLAMAERLAEAYLFDVLPRSGDLPPNSWDFVKSAPVKAEAKLRDHGGELIPGLAELYLLERLERRPEADRMDAPLHAMLRALLETERTGEGLWLDHIDPTTRRVREHQHRRVVDTWGYLANAFVMADIADSEGSGTANGDRYGGEVERMMRAAARLHGFRWEEEGADGYADTIESMLCLLPFHPIEDAAAWIDDEIAVMFAMQRRDGFVGRDYLDGNYVRTALLYAEWKTRGARLEPWREDVLIGGVIGAADRRAPHPVEQARLQLHLAAEAPWSGRLCLDGVRHRTSWAMRLDYPRRNGSPEWFTVERDRSYVVRDLDSGAASVHDGAALLAGIPLSLAPGRPRRLAIEAQ